MSEPILKLEGLKKHFNTTTGGAFNKQKAVLKAVDGIDLEVAPGETIGLVGSTGWSTGPHLHFEIRISGELYDPMGWFGGKKSKVSCVD